MEGVSQSVVDIHQLLDWISIFIATTLLTFMIFAKFSKNGVFRVKYTLENRVFWTQALAIMSGIGFWSFGLAAVKTNSETLCNIGMLCAAALYGSVTIFLYIFLFLRSYIVKFGRGFLMKVLEPLLLFMLVCYAVSSVPLLILRSSGRFVPIHQNPQTTTCVYEIDSWMAVYMLIFDSILSSGFLALFVIPLISGSAAFRSKAKENLLLSSIMILSTTFTALLFFFYATDPNSSTIASCVVSIDIVINIACALSITRKAWTRSRRLSESDSVVAL